MAKIFMEGTAYFLFDKYIYRAENFTDDKEMVIDTAYIKDGFVYVYRGQLPDEEFLRKPASIYKDSSGNLIWTDLPNDEQEKKRYSEDCLSILDMDNIVTEVTSNLDDLISPEIGVVGTHGEVFIPTIHETDDILKKIIKCAIVTKHIDLSNYVSKSSSKWLINNLKSNLISDKPMSYKYFTAWCDLLGLDFTISINDNGQDKIAPLTNEYQVDTLGRIFTRPDNSSYFSEIESHDISKDTSDDDE